MPCRKSVRTLQELCLQITVEHLKTLQHEAKFLPQYFVNKLYNRCYLAREKIDFQLPAHLFLHPKLKQLHHLNFDLEHTEVVKTLSRDCKNLRRIILRPQTVQMSADSLIAITTNNPRIMHINLREFKGLTDHHLLLISKHCPQVQYLNLCQLNEITDECMDHLPINLKQLDLRFTKITPNGCVMALNRLKHLKQLQCHFWMEIFRLLQRKQHLKPTFTIESVFIEDTNENLRIEKALFDMFPKLQDIGIVMSPDPNFLTSIVESEKHGLITYVCICFLPVDTILFIGRFCPMLESIAAIFSRSNFPNETDTSFHDQQEPFKHLHRLHLDMNSMFLSFDEIKAVVLTLNCRLQSLSIESWHQLDEGFIDDLLEANLLQKVEAIRFRSCRSLTFVSLKKLLTSLDALKFMNIYNCRNISSNECKVLEKVVSEMNFDVNLDLQYTN